MIILTTPIKWRNKDIKKLRTYVQKFNSAITRLEKQNPSLKGTGILPERLSTKDLKYIINTRADFNYQMRKIDRFFKPGARDIVTDSLGLKQTKWQQKEIQYLEQSINAKKRAFNKKYSIPKVQQKFLNLEPIDIKQKQKEIQEEINKLEEPEDKLNKIQKWYNFLYEVERESQQDYYERQFFDVRNSYLKAIENHLLPQDAIELMTLLQENDIWGTDILWAISKDNILDFEYYYSLDDIREKGQNVIEIWKDLIPKLKKLKEREKVHEDYWNERNRRLRNK